MLTVVSLHGCFEVGELVVNLLVNGNIDLCGSCPQHNDTGTAVLLLERTDILANLFHHVPAVLALFYVISV